MSEILNANRDFEEAVKETMAILAKELGNFDTIKYMDENEFKALQSMLKLTDAAIELQKATVEVLDKIDKQVEELNEKLLDLKLLELESKVH